MLADKKNLGDDNKPRVVILNSSEQMRKIRQAVACRAYELFANRGSVGGHELENWRQAEAELTKPLSCGLMQLEENLWVEAGTAAFRAGSIEIWVAARNITICGRPCSSHMNVREAEHVARDRPEMIFRVMDLPVEIDPSGTTVKLNGLSMEILLKKAKTEPEQKVKAAAA
jgi:HSP20 family molecular chaperone IbpA